MLILGVTLLPGSARATAREPDLGLGAYAGVSFGSGLSMRFSFGAQFRATTKVGDWHKCDNKGFTMGGVTRLDFVAWNEPRLILGAIGTRFDELKHATVEASVGLRLHDLGLDGLAGLQLGGAPYAARVDHTFNRSLWQTTGGLVFGSEWMNLASCDCC